MINPWFKFYGGEYLSDPKMLALSATRRSCWISLLCYASMTNGVVKHLAESQLMSQAGVNFMEDEWEQTKGVLEQFKELGMIRVDDKAITIVNWNKRQETFLTGYERTKRYREKNKEKIDARGAVKRAIDKGILKREVCEICGSSDTEAHHEDYSKPLEVAWLCKKHHENMHHDDTVYTDRSHEDDDRIEENRIDKNRRDTTKVSFEKIWEVYPNSNSKKKAEAKWASLPTNLQSRILEDVAKRKESPPWRKEGGKYVPMLISYLNQERWNDPIISNVPPESVARFGKAKVKAP